MSFLGHSGYQDRFNGKNKTVFRGDELVYTVNPQDLMGVINDGEWYDDAVLQTEVWEHNLERLRENDIPLTFDEQRTDLMFYRIDDTEYNYEINGKIIAPALIATEFEEVDAYGNRDTWNDIGKEEERQIKWMQEELDELIASGEIAVEEKECVKNDYRGPSCLRQWGRNKEGDVFLLEFGEYHHQLEGPMTGPEFLEEHGIERNRHGVRNPIMLGDMSEYAWQSHSQ